MSYFYIIIGFIIIERLIELQIAARNEQWMKSRGAIEVGGKHHKYFILVHILFFLALMIELQFVEAQFNLILFVLFLCAQIGRVWCIYSLGKFWNTKVIVLPNVLLIKKGQIGRAHV